LDHKEAKKQASAEIISRNDLLLPLNAIGKPSPSGNNSRGVLGKKMKNYQSLLLDRCNSSHQSLLLNFKI
jgi:hypothetical protein